MNTTQGIGWIAAAVLVFGGAPRASAQESHCSAHTAHSDHATGVDARGDAVMGFDHDKTTHHFLLAPDGGSIEVTANAEDDAGSVEAIRGHLPHIARMFSDGDFEAPMLVHDRVPPGVPVMRTRKSSIRWKYEELPAGGRVVATTRDRKALAAIHEFLRFQIADHRTADPGTVEAAPAGTGKRPTG